MIPSLFPPIDPAAFSEDELLGRAATAERALALWTRRLEDPDLDRRLHAAAEVRILRRRLERLAAEIDRRAA